MNKITRMTPKGAALIMAEHYDSPEQAKADVSARCRQAFEKLYQYESLDLEPEEIEFELIDEKEKQSVIFISERK